MEITIIGGGSSAHVLIPFLASSGNKVNILTRKPDKWSQEILLRFNSIDDKIKQVFKGKLDKISNRPHQVIPQADIIILCMSVSKYRTALNNISKYINLNKDVFIGAIYGQAGFNWMVNEIKTKYNLSNIITFAVGLVPWICRTIEYGNIGVIYGCKEVNVVAVSPSKYFTYLNESFLKNICERWLNKGSFHQSDNFLSLTLSVDNQIIHPSRCYCLFKKYGGKWKKKDEIPYFYRDYDQLSAEVLKRLDSDYSKIRDRIKIKYPQIKFQYMLDYLEFERLSYQSDNTDICASFTTSQTLGAIKPPTIKNKKAEWEIDINHRFFTDDIHYGICIAKYIAEQLELKVPTIDEIIDWAQNLLKEKIIENDRLLLKSADLISKFKSGIPPVYGLHTIDDIVNLN